jgi:hypothetical protein
MASSAAKKPSVALCVFDVKRTEFTVEVVMLRTASKVNNPSTATKKIV